MIKVINFIINLVKIIYLPIILPLCLKARKYVYNYYLKNNIFLYYLPIVEFKENKYYYKGTDNIFIEYIETEKYKFYLYYYFVWIWSDDMTLDNINLNVYYNKHNFFKKYLNIISNDIITIQKTNEIYSNSFNTPNITLSNKYTLLFYISIFFNSNNYYRTKFFTTKKSTKYKKLVFINKTPVYKYEL